MYDTNENGNGDRCHHRHDDSVSGGLFFLYNVDEREEKRNMYTKKKKKEG